MRESASGMLSAAERSRDDCSSLPEAVSVLRWDSLCAVGMLALGWLEELLGGWPLLLAVFDWLGLCVGLLDDELLDDELLCDCELEEGFDGIADGCDCVCWLLQPTIDEASRAIENRVCQVMPWR